MENQKKLVCSLCSKELETETTYFNYLGHSFSTEILKCPICGEVYIPEELVKGRMKEVETQLEDK